MDNLFIVRHGETVANESDVEAGPLDYPLAKKGVKEASFVSESLEEVKFTGVYSSPIFRAVQTAKILARPRGLKVKKLEDLTEAKLKPGFVGKIGRHHILTTPHAFAETYKELQDRMVRAVDIIRKEGSGNVMMVSHGDPIVALLDKVVERKIGKTRDYVIHPDPGALCVIELRDKPKLVLFNYRRKLFDDY